ncbi:MAG: hypothetical protein JSS78_11550 [Bacteroidetes bacterium]|nr:hypothetical protein [Bacteroidota bacterium]
MISDFELQQIQIEIQDRSFQTYANVVHDIVGPALTLCKLHLHEMERLENNQEIKPLIDQSQELLTQAISNLRSIVHSPGGENIQRMGLDAALNLECLAINRQNNCRVHYSSLGEIYSFRDSEILLIFRVVQQYLIAIIETQQTRDIDLLLESNTTLLSIKIGFDGIIIVPMKTIDQAQLRVKLLSGKIALSTNETKHLITIDIPIPQ